MVPTLMIMVPRVLSQIRELKDLTFAINGEGHCRSSQRRDLIDRLVVPGANNIRSYPEIVWKSDADGRLGRFNLWTF